MKGVAPVAQLGFTLTQKRPDKALEGLSQGGVWDVPLVLVELAGREEATRRDEHLVQLVHHRGLADTGIARHEHQLRRAIGHDTVEGSEQCFNLRLSAIKLLRDKQPVRYIVCAELERVDAAVRLPFRQAAPEIAGNTSSGLIPLLCGLRQQLHHDR